MAIKRSEIAAMKFGDVVTGRRLFGVEPQSWMNLQSQYDLEIALRDRGAAVDSDVTPLQRAA